MAGEAAAFVIYFVAGCAGASLYLLLLLMTDRDVEILRNKIVANLRLMTLMYIIAGGVFAAVVQISTGNPLQMTSLQAVLLLGFGWQGALSGVGATGKVTAMKRDLNQYLNAMQENAQTLVSRKDKEIEDIKAYLEQIAGQGGKAGGQQ